jgi:hypothetical protein
MKKNPRKLAFTRAFLAFIAGRDLNSRRFGYERDDAVGDGLSAVYLSRINTGWWQSIWLFW